jgi:predicted nucleic acid-binding protein
LTHEWVVDASVGIKLFVPEDLSDQAEQVLSADERLLRKLKGSGVTFCWLGDL